MKLGLGLGRGRGLGCPTWSWRSPPARVHVSCLKLPPSSSSTALQISSCALVSERRGAARRGVTGQCGRGVLSRLSSIRSIAQRNAAHRKATTTHYSLRLTTHYYCSLLTTHYYSHITHRSLPTTTTHYSLLKAVREGGRRPGAPSAVGLEAAAHLHVRVGQVALVLLEQRLRRLVHVPDTPGREVRQEARSPRPRDRRLGRRLASSSTRGGGWALRWPASSPRERHTAQRRRGRRAGALPRGALGPAKGGTLPPCCGACESSSPALT